MPNPDLLLFVGLFAALCLQFGLGWWAGRNAGTRQQR